MKVRNIAIGAAQFGAGAVAGVVASPFIYIGVAATGVKIVASIAQEVSMKAISEITEQLVVIDRKLESMKVAEPEIVQEPIGDTATAVN